MPHKPRKHTRIDVRDAELVAYYPLLKPHSCQVLDYGLGGARCLLKTKGLDDIASRSWIAALMMRSELEFELTRVSSKRLRAAVRHAAVLNEDSVVFGLEFQSDDAESRVSLERARVIFDQQSIEPAASNVQLPAIQAGPKIPTISEELEQDEDLVEIEATEASAEPLAAVAAVAPPKSDGAPLTFEVVGEVEVISVEGDDEPARPKKSKAKPHPSSPPVPRRRSSRKLRIILEKEAFPAPALAPAASAAPATPKTPAKGESPTKVEAKSERKNEAALPTEHNVKPSAEAAPRRAEAAPPKPAVAQAPGPRASISGFLRSIFSRFAGDSAADTPNYRSMRLGEILRTVNCCTESQLADWTRRARSKDMKLGAFLVHEKVVTQRELNRMLSLQAGLPTVNLKEVPVGQAKARLSKRHWRALKIVPFNQVDATIYVACTRRLTELELKQLELDCGKRIKLFLASDEEFEAFLERVEATPNFFE